MESKNTLWLVLGLVILVAAAYVVWQYVLPALAAGQLDAKKNEAKALYLKSLTVGKDADSYSYSYIENMGGYVVKTTLLKNGQRYEAILESPLAKREIFYLENTTILCVTFDGYESCSPVENNTKLRNYLKGMKGYFFSNEQFQANNDTVGLLISNGALTFDSAEKSSVDGKECNFIKYLINYSLLSLSDSIKLGITSSSPLLIYGEICYDDKTNEIYSKAFDYKRLGKEQTTTWKLLESKWTYTKEIEVGRNLTNDTAISLLYSSVEMQNQFITCLDKGGLQSDACVFSFAINNEYPQVCEYAGTKADFCTMNFAIFNRDVKMCEDISDAKVKDDCYIEIAGKLKNEALCDSLVDKSRKQYCFDVISGKVNPITVSNETINETVVPELENDTNSFNKSEEETKALQDIFDKLEIPKNES